MLHCALQLAAPGCTTISLNWTGPEVTWNASVTKKDDGFKETYFKELYPYSQHIGVWYTSFIAFVNNNSLIKDFLDGWFTETLKYESNYDRLSFAYICYKKNMMPYTLPDKKVYGIPHLTTEFYIRHIE